MLGLNRLQSIDPRAIVAHFSGVSSVATALLFAFTAQSATNAPDARTIALLLLVGLTGVLGQYGLTLAYTRGYAPRVAVVTLSQVLFALVLDVAIWQRRINAISLLGMMLVVAPTAWLLLGKGRVEAETSVA